MAHLQTVLNGVSPGGEVWSTSLRWASAIEGESPKIGPGVIGSYSAAQLTTCATAITQQLTAATLPTRLKNGMSSALTLANIRVNQLADDGTLVNAGEAFYETPIAGLTAANRPLQSAFVTTLNYGAAYGKHYRGRFYWPAVGNAPLLDSLVQVGQAERTFWLGDMQDFLAVLRAALGTGLDVPPLTFRLVVFSPTTERVCQVENISCDNLMDRQSRRQDAVVVQRTLQALPI